MEKINFFNSIRNKLVIFMLAATLIPCVLILTIILNYSQKKLQNDIYISQKNNMEYIINKLDLVFDNIDLVSSSLLLDNKFLDYIQKGDINTSPRDLSNMNKYIHDRLTNMKNVNSNIDSISLIDIKNNRAFSSLYSGYLSKSNYEFSSKDYLKIVDDKSNVWTILDKKYTNPSLLDSTTNSLALVKPRYDNDELIYVIIIDLNINKIGKILKSLKIPEDSKLFLFNNIKEPIYSSDSYLEEQAINFYPKEKDLQLIQLQSINKHKYLIVDAMSNLSGIRIVSLIPVLPLFSVISQIKIVSIVGSIILLFSLGLFSLYIYILIYIPISKFINILDQNEKGIITYCPEPAKSEFFLIAIKFNAMLKKIISLNNNLLKQKLLAKDAQIQMLQTQVNPHFLYNSLDIMQWMIKMGELEKASKLNLSISNYFRSLISTPGELITIKRAINNINKYWEIIKLRYNNDFDIYIDVEENIYELKIPKRLLQPLLENAVIHGLEKKGTGLIIITMIKINDNLLITVEDNGVGIEEKELTIIKKQIKNRGNKSYSNFALKNIIVQLSLIYGEKASFEIESEIEKGTTVSILIKNIEGI